MFMFTAILSLLGAVTSRSYHSFHFYHDPYYHNNGNWGKPPSEWGHPYPHNHGNGHGYGSSHGYVPGHGHGSNYGYGHSYGPEHVHQHLPWEEHNGHPYDGSEWRPDTWGIPDNDALSRPVQEQTSSTRSTTESSMSILMCMKSCPVTPEYNPVCGSNGITYTNEGRLECASYCGIDVKLQRRTSCLAPETFPPSEPKPEEQPSSSPNIIDTTMLQTSIDQGPTDSLSTTSTGNTDASTASVFTNIDRDPINAIPLSLGDNSENKQQTTELQNNFQNSFETTSGTNDISTCCCDCTQNSANPIDTGSQNELITPNNPKKEHSFAEEMASMFTSSNTPDPVQSGDINNSNEPPRNPNGVTIPFEELASIFTSPSPVLDESTAEVTFDERIKDDSAIVFRDE